MGPLVRRVLRDPGARRADQQPRGLGQDRVHPQLRRGDGFYDHASAPVPPWKDGVGLSTVSTAGEIEGIQRAAHRARPPRPADRHLALVEGRQGQRRSVRPYLGAALPRTPLRRRRGKHLALAACRLRRPDFAVRLPGRRRYPGRPRPDQHPAERRAQGGRLLAAVLPAQSQILVLRAQEPARPGKGPAPYPRCPTSCTPRWPSTSPPASCA